MDRSTIDVVSARNNAVCESREILWVGLIDRRRASLSAERCDRKRRGARPAAFESQGMFAGNKFVIDVAINGGMSGFGRRTKFNG